MANRFDPSISLPSAPSRGIALAGAVLIVLFLSILRPHCCRPACLMPPDSCALAGC